VRYTICEVLPGMLMSLVHAHDVGLLLVVVFYRGVAVHRVLEDSSTMGSALIRHHFGV
jgi:hypothetical protein